MNEMYVKTGSTVLISLFNSKYNDISRSYSEIILIGFLWELYFNQSKWEDKMNEVLYDNSNLLYLDILEYTKHRLILTQNEINWICKFYIYISFNTELI